MRRNLIVFAALFVPVFPVTFYARSLWFRVFISDRLFTSGWVHWPMLLSWVPEALIFAASGIVLAILLRVDKLGRWVLAFGGLYSLIVFLMTSYIFLDSATVLDRLWAYGGLLVPPISCWLAAVYARHHANHRLRGLDERT